MYDLMFAFRWVHVMVFRRCKVQVLFRVVRLQSCLQLIWSILVLNRSIRMNLIGLDVTANSCRYPDSLFRKKNNMLSQPLDIKIQEEGRKKESSEQKSRQIFQHYLLFFTNMRSQLNKERKNTAALVIAFVSKGSAYTCSWPTCCRAVHFFENLIFCFMNLIMYIFFYRSSWENLPCIEICK